MPYQNISIELKNDEIKEISHLIEQLFQRMPFLINLTPEERINLPKMADKSVAFVEKALEFAENNPQLVPPYVNVDELRKDFQLSENLRPLLNQARQLVEKLDDTVLAVGSEAYVAALAFYNSAKYAAKSNVPGSDTVIEELSKRFAGQGRVKPTNPKQ